MQDSRCILLLDDEFLVLLDLQSELQRRGFSNIETAGNAAGAIAIVQEGAVDAAFLDVNLGKETSFGVAAALQERDIPFAFVTGYAKDAIDAAFSDIPILTKPISASDVEMFLLEKKARKFPY